MTGVVWNRGYELKAICTYCGAANLECRKCGAPLGEQPEPETPTPVMVRDGDDVSQFEAKVVFQSNWLKQTLDYTLPRGDEIRYSVPRSGIATQLKIFFNYEARLDDWRLQLVTGVISLLDRGNTPGRVDVIRRVTDTEMTPNLYLAIRMNVAGGVEYGGFGRPQKIELTRWVQMGAR